MGVSQEILFCTFLKKPSRKDVHIAESCFTHNNRAYEVGSSIGIFWSRYDPLREGYTPNVCNYCCYHLYVERITYCHIMLHSTV